MTALNEEATPEMVFPAVTICNINRFRFSALTDADIYHLANLTGLPPKNRDGHKPTDLMYPAPDMQDIFNRTGHQLEEMLMSCNFSGQNCSVEDFSVVSAKLLESFAELNLCLKLLQFSQVRNNKKEKNQRGGKS